MIEYLKKKVKIVIISLVVFGLIISAAFYFGDLVSAGEIKSYDSRNVNEEFVSEDMTVEETEEITDEITTVETQISQTQATEQQTTETKTKTVQQTKQTATQPAQIETQAQEDTLVQTVSSTPQEGVPLTDAQGKAIAAQNAAAYAAQVNQVLNITNQYRAENGLAPLQLDSTLTLAAMFRTAEMAHLENGTSQVSHTRPNGLSFSSIVNVYGISCSVIGENILDVYNTPESAMSGWINSASHRENILGNYTKMGVGVAVASNGIYYWSQLFTR